MTPLVDVENLRVVFHGDRGRITHAVESVSFDLAPGVTLGLVGESGCGKSVTALAIMGLLPKGSAEVSGRVSFDGNNLLDLTDAAMRDLRGDRLAMIFQEPMTSLNPAYTIGEQIIETLVRHRGLARGQARARAIELLQDVRIPSPEQRVDEYPHKLSGGMRQRAMIAMALACDPELLIADEPTTALDVTIQAQVLDVLRELQKTRRMSLMLITHDLGVVSEMAHRVAVMYAGEIVETAPREAFFSRPAHPYSRKLFDSLPSGGKRGAALAVIRGSVPPLNREFTGCRFADRCDSA